jgi:hypothetical protein
VCYVQLAVLTTPLPLRSIEQAREPMEFLYHHSLHMSLGELPFPEPPRLLDRPGRHRCHAAVAGATCAGELTSCRGLVSVCVSRCAMQTIFGSQPLGRKRLQPQSLHVVFSIQESCHEYLFQR